MFDCFANGPHSLIQEQTLYRARLTRIMSKTNNPDGRFYVETISSGALRHDLHNVRPACQSYERKG